MRQIFVMWEICTRKSFGFCIIFGNFVLLTCSIDDTIQFNYQHIIVVVILNEMYKITNFLFAKSYLLLYMNFLGESWE